MDDPEIWKAMWLHWHDRIFVYKTKARFLEDLLKNFYRKRGLLEIKDLSEVVYRLKLFIPKIDLSEVFHLEALYR